MKIIVKKDVVTGNFALLDSVTENLCLRATELGITTSKPKNIVTGNCNLHQGPSNIFQGQ